MVKIKDKICTHCKLRKNCEDLPGFCLLLPYAAITGVIIMLAILLYNSNL
jgi:hypothetical protein